ncbi:MAG: CdaR family protein [Candidatus Limnocylindria bacterium]
MMGFLLRNWHLKLSAVLLAMVLYTGLVFSGSFSEDTIMVPVNDVNQPGDTFLLSGELGLVEVRYRTVNANVSSVVADAFVATIDFSDYEMDEAPAPQVLDVNVSSLREGIEVLSVNPRTVRVELDRIEERSVPVEVDDGVVPEGLETDDPVLSVDEVSVRGPASAVNLVDRAIARIRIDPSGINFNSPVELVPVDVAGQPVTLVDVEPRTISVQVGVQEVETERTVTVNPQVSGTPAPGFALESLTVEPTLVTLRGVPEDLSEISSVLTEELSIEGASGDQTFQAELVLPADTRLADATAEPVVTVVAGIGPSVSSRSFVLGVICQGAGESACLPGLDQLTVTLSGPGGVLSGLTAADLTPVLDASGLAPGSYSLTPQIGGLPEGVELLGISPGSVTVTITAPETPAPTPSPTPVP